MSISWIFTTQLDSFDKACLLLACIIIAILIAIVKESKKSFTDRSN